MYIEQTDLSKVENLLSITFLIYIVVGIGGGIEPLLKRFAKS